MFTGLIDAICQVKSVSTATGSMRLAVDLPPLPSEVKVSDSIAVNGVCLTVTAFNGGTMTFDISDETLAKSTLGKLRPTQKVNIERALKPTDRISGHIVQGHVDGTATIKTINKQGQFVNMDFAANQELLENMIPKGSVAVDGISLTVAQMTSNSFSVALIPQTLKNTTLGQAKIGDTVNIETDIIIKTVKKQLQKILPHKQNLTIEKLKEMGF